MLTTAGINQRRPISVRANSVGPDCLFDALQSPILRLCAGVVAVCCI